MAAKKVKIIAGNWKMNPTSIGEAKEIFLSIKKQAHNLKRVKTIIFPPFIYLNLLKKLYVEKSIALGGQDVFYENKGAFTGEISPLMIESVGGSYCLIGHSERRALGEASEMVNKKVLAALKAGLNVILCIGEKERDREGQYFLFLKDQITVALLGVQKKYLENIIIAYEPVWAIGKEDKDAMNPKDVNEMGIFIRKILIDHFKTSSAASTPILYGGSVSRLTARDLISIGEIDGLLLGRPSLEGDHFNEILRIANDLA